ncbi:MAG: hypothetical protein IKH85_02120 [Methanobrevibacter sp.]|nr:hypothetical protein [Methanobrevibacter sp.]
MDTNGNLIIEIAIAAVIILLICGAILTSFENTTNKIVSAQEKENMETLISEVVDNLINNPGIPDNWFEISKGTPGLAITNEEGEIIPNSVSYPKFIALGENYKKLMDERLFKSKIHTSLELTPKKSAISSVKIGSNDESDDVYSVNRLVKCDFYKKFVIKDFKNEGKCNHDQAKTSCNYFKVFEGNLKRTDYYLLVDDSQKYDLKYTIGTTRVVKQMPWETTMSDCIYLNNKIEFYDDTDAIVFIHFNQPKAKVVLVGVPKNFDEDKLEYDYFRTNDCQLTLKAWY